MQGLFQRFFSLHRPLISKLNELLGEYDLSYSLWQVILYLKNNQPSSLVDIANYYNIEKPSITRRVQRLEERLIVKTISGKDRREKIIELTEIGEKLYDVCRERITQLENDVVKGISEDDQIITFETLPKIQKNITNEKEI
ncbi:MULTISPECIES: MarR family winged helix-turn-helix transcriptional regulator [Clostridium]|jgi:transcriptional regulator, MarR family|uniref:MarR family transcriptional regulator n=4 Tax=Clostridium TaxID=1485 RepID=A0A1S8QAA5_CLOBE|nr:MULTISPECIES: MarR family transcriptional regulator [Clostridium]ABR36027.1 transcriptional regulator, MarR family [Clostridium beijerinckii NCIMB 8052]AIU03621.1 MarR family transcriptional regulator [Clostridium beijerinckii ATCC 35702]ALB44919.1 MarR family transcriptional regulator [Clostridium beijerinckii NRRL B-598]MBC2460498.1 MarR family transcriptional regulator [Clostridium beijerinckii]MBC2477972.1 MarR family transcriptional regulator [Clostridium beijerinckii]